MNDSQEGQEFLEGFSRSGVLPQKVSPTGSDGEPLSEVIICDSTSGGAKYKGAMPQSLSLIRRFANGREIRMDYSQREGVELLDTFDSFFVGHGQDEIMKKVSQLKESDGEGWLTGEILRLVYARVTDRYKPEDSCGT